MNVFFNSVYEWMFGCFSSPKSSEAGIDDSSSTTMSKRSELNEGNNDIRLDHDTRRQDSKEVKNVDKDDDEVQFVGEVQSPQPQFNPPGHRTIIDLQLTERMSKRQKLSFFHLEGLPDEILLEIFSLMDIRGVLQCGQVSNRLRAISNDKSLWEKVGCDRFLHRTHAPRMFRFQCAPSF